LMRGEDALTSRPHLTRFVRPGTWSAVHERARDSGNDCVFRGLRGADGQPGRRAVNLHLEAPRGVGSGGDPNHRRCDREVCRARLVALDEVMLDGTDNDDLRAASIHRCRDPGA